MTTKQGWFQKTMRFPEEFRDIYEKFEKIIKMDPEVMGKATKRQKASGFESLGVRTAIQIYVETKEYLLIEKMVEKQVKEDKKDAQANDIN